MPLGLDIRRFLEGAAATDPQRPAPLFTNPVLAPPQPDVIASPVSMAGLQVPEFAQQMQGGSSEGIAAVDSGLSFGDVLGTNRTPEEQTFLSGIYEESKARGLDEGTALGRVYENAKQLESGTPDIWNRNYGLNPMGLLNASSAPFEMAGEALATVGEPAVKQLPEQVQEPARRGLQLAPAFLAGPGGVKNKALALGAAVAGGEATEAAGIGRGAGEFVAPIAGPAAVSAIRGRLNAPVLSAAAQPDDMSAWEYSLKKLAEAKAKGPEAFKAEQARQAEIVRQREVAAREVEKANARLNFSPAEKARRTELAEQVAEAHRKAREVYGDAVDDLPDDVPYIAGSAPLGPPISLRQTRELAHFSNMTKGVIENKSTMQRVYDAARPFTAAVSGDVPDSKLAELLAREGELRDVMTRSASATGKPFTNDEIDYLVEVWREAFLGRFYRGPALAEAKKMLAERSKAAFGGELSAVDTIADTWKSTALNADISIFGQQIEAAFRRGSVPVLSGVIRDSVNRIAAKMNMPGVLEVYLRNDIDHVSQAMADGLQMAGGKTADINVKGSLFGRIPGIGKSVEAALDKLADVQYGNILGTVRLRAYEGLLTQNKIIHDLSGGRLAGDITDPLVRRHIAEMANMIGSTARTATGAQRAKWERRGLLSPRMTRAQINEVLTPLRSFRSQEDVINTANLIGSFVLTLAAGKVLNDQFGISDFVTDPFEYGFGQIVLSSKDKDGRNHVIDIFPQFAFAKTLVRSVNALKEGDMRKLQEAWQRYAFGRLNMIPGLAGRVAGYGYDDDGRFHALGRERMSLEQAVKGDDPLEIAVNNVAPMTVRQIAESPTDPVNVGTAVVGQGTFEESVYGAEDRFARQMGAEQYRQLDLLDQAKVHVAMDAEGIPIDDWRRAGPYFGADDKAFALLKEREPLLQDFDSLPDFRNEATRRFRAAGANKQQASEALQRMEEKLGLTNMTNAVRKAVVAEDPRIVESLQTLYEADELSFPPSKELTDLANQVKTGATR